jgi:PilZ domain
MATQDFMSKTTQDGVVPRRAPSQTERRGSRRCKITQLMRIRPSDPEKEHFDDLRGTLSVSRSGVYFQTSEKGYEVGMRLFVTMPYNHDATTVGREYLAEVVRVDPIVNGMTGVGFKILMEIGMQAPSFHGNSMQRK